MNERRYAVALVGGVKGGEFALCVGERCSQPIPWDASAEQVADAVRDLGVGSVSSSGGPLPDEEVLLTLSSEFDLTADETNSLTASPYFGGAGCAVVVGELAP